ncbi:ATP-binding protein [Desulfosoma sp.]|uniref:ATP-binding protein n=1 Tax=Desulfosoma sp. TaxID=2603217 RepID=UPI00404A63CE
MWYRSLGFKLIFAVGAVMAVVFAVFFYGTLQTQSRETLDEMVRSVHLASEIVRRSLRYDMLQYQPERLHRAIDTIGGHERIEKVRIFNAMGKIIYSSHKAEMGTYLDKTAEQCYACHTRERPFERLDTSERTRIFLSEAGYRVLGMINPIYNEPDCFSGSCHVHPPDQKVLGVLDIDVSLEGMDRALERMRTHMFLLAMCAVAAIAAVLVILIHRFLNRPLHHLLQGIERVGAGDLSTPIVVHSGDEIGALATSFNIMTERLRVSERELRESEAKYRSLFENDPNPIFVLDLETFHILDVNIRAVETYGYSREEFLGMSFLDLAEERDARKIQELATQACIFLPRVRHRRKSGDHLYVNIHSCPRLHLGRDVIIANIADITDRVQTEAQLIQAAKMATLGEMSAGVAHELNQPLNAIRIGCEFFLKKMRRGEAIDADTMAKVATQMVEQVERASNIINHLREFGRKSDAFEMEPVDINRPIQNVFTVLGQQLRLRQIRVELDLAQGLPPVLGVANRLEQVFLNLVMNARDAMEERRHRGEGEAEAEEMMLHIRTFQEGDRVVVEVRDTGTGIPEGVRERIFEPFFTTKEVGRGTGLGLSISYGIVKECGGSIEVHSEEGRGTTFRLTLPACREPEDWAGLRAV